MKASHTFIVTLFSILCFVQVAVALPVPSKETSIAHPYNTVSKGAALESALESLPEVTEDRPKVISAKFLSLRSPPPPSSPSFKPNVLVKREDAHQNAVVLEPSIIYVLIGVIGILAMALGGVIAILTVFFLKFYYKQERRIEDAQIALLTQLATVTALSKPVPDQTETKAIDEPSQTQSGITEEHRILAVSTAPENVQMPTRLCSPSNAEPVEGPENSPQSSTSTALSSPITPSHTPSPLSAFLPDHQTIKCLDAHTPVLDLSNSFTHKVIQRRMPELPLMALTPSSQDLSFTPPFESTPIVRARSLLNGSEISFDFDVEELRLDPLEEALSPTTNEEPRGTRNARSTRVPITDASPSIISRQPPQNLIHSRAYDASSHPIPFTSSNIKSHFNHALHPSPVNFSFTPPLTSTPILMAQDIAIGDIDLTLDVLHLQFDTSLATSPHLHHENHYSSAVQQFRTNGEPSMASLKDLSSYSSFDFSTPEMILSPSSPAASPTSEEPAHRHGLCWNRIEEDSIFIVSLPPTPSDYAVSEEDPDDRSFLKLLTSPFNFKPNLSGIFGKDPEVADEDVVVQDDVQSDRSIGEIGRACEDVSSVFHLSDLPDTIIRGAENDLDASYMKIPYVPRKPPTTWEELQEVAERVDRALDEQEAWLRKPLPVINDSYEWDFKHHLIMNAELLIDENFMDESLNELRNLSLRSEDGVVPAFETVRAESNGTKRD